VKELIGAQLVVEESAERFAFRHALTREAIYGELLARERVALHREVAAALERQHADSLDAVVEVLAYHAWESGDWERAAGYVARAARHARALSAPREAVAHLDRAFAAMERCGGRTAVEWYIDRGRANETLGEFQRANEDFTVALVRARDARAVRIEWEALYALGMLWAARDYNRAGDYRRDALQVARSLGDESLVARSLNRVGNWYVNHEQPRTGLPYHQEALAIVERLGDDAGVAETVDLIAMANHIAGVQPEAAAQYARSVELFTKNGDRRGLAQALALLSLCSPSYHSSSTTPFTSAAVDEELRVLRCVRIARDIGWRAGEAFVRFVSADALMWRGEYDRAIPLAREALALAREIEHLEWSAGSMRLLGAISLDLLATADAREQLEGAHAIARRLGSHVWMRWTAAPLAIALGRSGDSARAVALLESASRAAGDDDESRPDAGDAGLTLGERQLWLARAEVALAEGQPERALAIVDARLAAEKTANPQSHLGVPRLLLARAEALTALGKFKDAEETLDEAHGRAEAQGARPILWRIEAARGHLFRLQRQRLEARRAFDAAQTLASELAARIPDGRLRTAFVEGVGSFIPAVAAPSPDRAAKEALGGLTKRERDVAELVAQGKQNRAIARQLGIGERTVESYVTSALAKLDLTSRTQLAAWAIDKGIARSGRT